MDEKLIGKPFPFKRIIVAISVILLITAIHIFRVGTFFSGKMFNLYYSYFSDIVIPIAIYFMLCINDFSIPRLKNWKMKLAIVFISASAAEIAQAFGIYLLGSTFDPLDFAMYGLGTILAVGLDKLFSIVFSFWPFGSGKESTIG